MIIEKLELTDFRVFQGRHEFDLTPRKKWKKQRPIILFGGLNGAGKTTILTGVLLALYGRQSLGTSTSQKQYHEFLKESIHTARDSIVQANAAKVALTFSYAQAGVLSHFEVVRSWVNESGTIKEWIKITKDGARLRELTDEQAQAFLNELIPIGVSDLFFFDGEKIKELAEDKAGIALADAIKRLLGLDLIERLNADLNGVLRRFKQNSAGAELIADMEGLEKQLAGHERRDNALLDEYETVRASIAEQQRERDRIRDSLQASGGAWAETRADYERRQRELLEARDKAEAALRDEITGSYPLAFAQSRLNELRETLLEETQARQLNASAKLIGPRLEKLKSKLEDELGKLTYGKVDNALRELFEDVSAPNQSIIHDIGDGECERLHQIIDSASRSSARVVTINEELREIEDELAEVSIQIGRAPDEQTLAHHVEELNNVTEQLAIYEARAKTLKEERKRNLREAMDTVRALKKKEDLLSSTEETNRNIELVSKTKALLKAFVVRATELKIGQLEKEFTACFQDLARKEDVQITAKIDPISFAVRLISGDDVEIDKNRLSAGEKQIYAISMLQALARTSGRNLPMIIDTPLGRLDSYHRKNLVENYFPKASQQVVILSTDTEVDEQFYRDLFKDISHAYQLEYDPETGATTETEGYFWRNQEQEVA